MAWTIKKEVSSMSYVPTPIPSPIDACPFPVVQQPLDPGPFDGFSLDAYTQQSTPPPRPTRAVYAQEFAKGIPEGIACRTNLLTLSGCAIQQADQGDNSLFQSVALLLIDETTLGVMDAQAERLQALITPPSKLPSLMAQAGTIGAELLSCQDLDQGRLLQEQLGNLGTQILQLQALSVESLQLKTIIAQARESLRAGKSPREILAHSETLENWVRILRGITTGWWNKIGIESPESEVFQTFRSSFGRHVGKYPDQAILDRYSQKMGSVKDGFPGGGPEIQALSQALGQTIHVVNVRLFKQDCGDKPIVPPEHPQGDLYLICGIAPDHYDALYPRDKIPDSVVAEMKDENRYYTPYLRLDGVATEPPPTRPLPECYIDPWANPFHLTQPITAEALALALPESHRYKADVQSLQGCSIQKVVGDGHCLFRSIAVLLMNQTNLETLQKHADNFQQFMSPEIQLKDLFEKTQGLIRTKNSPGAILCSDPSLSKGWILFLRNLVVDWWISVFSSERKSDFAPTFIEEARARGNTGDEDTILAQYMSTMGSYDDSPWGGEAEIVAFQQALGMNIHVVDLQTPKEQRRGPLIPAGGNPTDLYLLRSSKPDHYDALYIPGQQPW
jgi:hypothetical protein